MDSGYRAGSGQDVEVGCGFRKGVSVGVQRVI